MYENLEMSTKCRNCEKRKRLAIIFDVHITKEDCPCECEEKERSEEE